MSEEELLECEARAATCAAAGTTPDAVEPALLHYKLNRLKHCRAADADAAADQKHTALRNSLSSQCSPEKSQSLYVLAIETGENEGSAAATVTSVPDDSELWAARAEQYASAQRLREISCTASTAGQPLAACDATSSNAVAVQVPICHVTF